MIEKNMYVEVHNIIFEGGKRTAKIPEDTKNVPYEMYQKGFLIESANIGDTVEVETITGRVVKGELVKVNPTFDLGYGNFVPHILKIKKILRDELNE
ncbi:2-amino-4-oxopentanoate thiolase subunit OrtA [Mycoplasmatota bacterium WC44]